VARIREQERAEVAAVVHDQVLHTLALIQRNAGDTTSVVRLARGQERTLRNWLYKPAGSPTELFAAALEQAAAEVEDTYAISVETVIVGDAANDERVSALVAATREALVTAARHGKVGTVSLYAEAEEDKLTVFVRDRGAGFDLSSVDQDRHGVRGSIIGPDEPSWRSGRGRSSQARDQGGTHVAPVGRSQHDPGTSAGASAPCRRPLRVYLVDDHAMFRAGVRELGRTSTSWVSGYGGPGGGRDRVKAPDVVLLDVHMPDGGGRAVLGHCAVPSRT
jgi:anti-sigma regulatory factor (Ser/Thr protein kinase)